MIPPRIFSLILPFVTWAVLLVASSFHLYLTGVPLDGSGVHPGITVGADSRARHWQSVSLKTTAVAPFVGGSSTEPLPGVNTMAEALAEYWMLCLLGSLLRLLTWIVARSPETERVRMKSAALARPT